ncbi:MULTISPECIES: hypothetical protein [unclassified Microbacterium]|uniref:hypothetical protein n=1 Tax=unclassified Microbacterium TaxID=2609290 RepID=UPI003016F00A
MRIVVAGTHASGKSTLIADFHAALPEYLVLPDPFEDLDLDDPASESSFAVQLRVSASRLLESAGHAALIAERGPLDFLAYLVALERLGRSDGALLGRATHIVEESLPTFELLAVLPLESGRRIAVPDDEDPALREAMDEALLDLVDDLEDDEHAPRVVFLTGDPQERLHNLLDAVTARPPGS